MTVWHAPAGPVELPDGLAEMLQPDVARDILRVLVVGLEALARRDGVQVSARASRVLYALHEVAVRQDERQAAEMFVDEPTLAVSPTVEIATQDAASAMGCTVQHITRLCRSGLIRGRRIGRAWLVDQASLDAYRFGRGQTA